MPGNWSLHISNALDLFGRHGVRIDLWQGDASRRICVHCETGWICGNPPPPCPPMRSPLPGFRTIGLFRSTIDLPDWFGEILDTAVLLPEFSFHLDRVPGRPDFDPTRFRQEHAHLGTLDFIFGVDNRFGLMHGLHIPGIDGRWICIRCPDGFISCGENPRCEGGITRPLAPLIRLSRVVFRVDEPERLQRIPALTPEHEYWPGSPDQYHPNLGMPADDPFYRAPGAPDHNA